MQNNTWTHTSSLNRSTAGNRVHTQQLLLQNPKMNCTCRTALLGLQEQVDLPGKSLGCLADISIEERIQRQGQISSVPGRNYTCPQQGLRALNENALYM